MNGSQWTVYNPEGKWRVIVTKALPGRSWLEIFVDAGCRIEVYETDDILDVEQIRQAIGARCDAAIGQLNEPWGEDLFNFFKSAGGKVYCNYAVGFDNVDLEAAARRRIPVGNTPGVLTEATAELAVALTFAAARRVGESERFLRSGSFKGWLPRLFVGDLLWRRALGIIGAGRIGSAYARMMVEGHKMDLLYFSPRRNPVLEDYITDYGEFLSRRGLQPVSCRRAESIEDLLETADCVSIHTPLNPSTRHLIDRERLKLMKKDAILINTARGPVIDESALVAHCRENPEFRVGLDVFEDEPALRPGLAELENAVIVPHIGSATRYSRQAMATLAARNVLGVLKGYPLWAEPDIMPFLKRNAPKAVPSIVNAASLDL